MHQRFAVFILQAFQCFLDRFGLTGQVDDQRLFANHRDLPRQDRGRHEFEADLAHLFAKAGHFAVSHGECCFWCHVAKCRAGAAGGQHQMAAFFVDEFLQCCFDHRLFVGNQPGHRAPWWIADRELEPAFQRGDAFVLINAFGRAVADGDEPDDEFGGGGHGADYSQSLIELMRRSMRRHRYRCECAPRPVRESSGTARGNVWAVCRVRVRW